MRMESASAASVLMVSPPWNSASVFAYNSMAVYAIFVTRNYACDLLIEAYGSALIADIFEAGGNFEAAR